MNSLSKQNVTQSSSAGNPKLDQAIPAKIIGVGQLRKNINGAAGMSKTPKPRRRVLNKISDNPLLRPLDCNTETKKLSPLAEDPEITQMRRPPRLKVQRI